jgi:hypothetical protein
LPDTIAPVRSTLYLFLLRPPLPRLLSRTPWLPLLPPTTSIVAMATPAPMSSPSCRVAQLSFALGAKMIPCVMHASLVGTPDCPFLAPPELSSPLTSYTVTFGPPLFRVSLVTSITWSSSMTAPTSGLFRCARSLTPSPPSPISLPLCPRNLAAPSGAPSAIMDVSLITPPPTLSSSHGVLLRMSCSYTFPQNGKAECMIRTTNDVMRSLLFQASLPARYWTESLYTATYILNLLPTKAISSPTPYFTLFGTTPSYTHL